MTNLQLLLSIGIPSTLVILAWVSNNARLNGIQGRLNDVRSDMRDLRSDIKDFYGTIGRHDEAIDTLKSKA